MPTKNPRTKALAKRPPRKHPKSPGKPPSMERRLLRQATAVFGEEAEDLNPIDLASRLLEEAQNGGIDIDHLAEEIATYKKEATDRLLRASRKKYYSALARAYCLYLALTSRRAIRESLASGALGHKLRKNANMFQEVLRLVIDYQDPEGSRAGARALSRDAGALEWAFRNRIGPKDLELKFRSGEAGLERMYSEMKRIRANSRSARPATTAGPSPPAEAETNAGRGDQTGNSADGDLATQAMGSNQSVGSRPGAGQLKGENQHLSVIAARAAKAVAAGPSGETDRLRARWRLGKKLRIRLRSPIFGGRELIFRVFIGPDGQRVVRDAYQLSVPSVSDEEFEREMEGIGARLIEKGGRRPKV